MDIGATSHMSADQGIFSSYFNSSIKNNNIVVGSGHLVPIVGHGSTTLPSPYPPFHLNNVLHAPKLIKNLNLSVNSPLIIRFPLHLIPLVFL